MLETQESEVKNSLVNGMVLSATQKQNYLRDGFLVIPDFISADICHFLTRRAYELIENFSPDSIKTIFSAKDQRHANTDYFLHSGDKIRFFFEEGAIDAEGNLKCEKKFCINKIGHALHDLDPVFKCFSRSHKIAALVNDIGIIEPLLLQSMYICKQPFIGGEVNCHQDSTYLFIKDQPVTGLWFALEDATIENGCLWAIPGGQNMPLKSRMIRYSNDHIATEVYDDTPWPTEKLIPLEVTRGSCIVLHGLLPHMSKENITSRSRHAYALHLMSNLYEYAKDNWLQRPKTMPFSGFYTL